MNLFRNWASKALLIFCIVIFAFTGAWAEESEMTPEATEEIMEAAPEEEQPEETPEVPTEDIPVTSPQDLFQMEIKVPQNWRNDAAVNVRLKITPKTDALWSQVKIRLGEEAWRDLKDDTFLFDGYYFTDIEVNYNTKVTARLFIADGQYFDVTDEVKVFDRIVPDVTAGFQDMLLHVEATDDLSGVAGIQVNGLLFTTLENGVLDVRMEDPLNGYKQLAIRAYDYAGNFSDPVTLDNPYYMEATPVPTAAPTREPTPKPTKKPSGNSGNKAEATKKPSATKKPAEEQVIITPAPATEAPKKETVYVPLGPGQPYQNAGNMQTLDMLYSAATNKQFITVQTKAGQTYYMVIDYDKPIDEKNEIYETYFLNLVDDRDLMSVVSEEEIVPTPTPQVIYVTPEPTTAPQLPVEPEEPKEEAKAPASAAPLLLILAVAAGGGALWFLKFRKNNKRMPDADEEYIFEDDNENEE